MGHSTVTVNARWCERSRGVVGGDEASRRQWYRISRTASPSRRATLPAAPTSYRRSQRFVGPDARTRTHASDTQHARTRIRGALGTPSPAACCVTYTNPSRHRIDGRRTVDRYYTSRGGNSYITPVRRAFDET